MVISHRSLFAMFGPSLISFIAGVLVLATVAASQTPEAANSSQNTPNPKASPDNGSQTSELSDAPKPRHQQPSADDEGKVYETRVWWRDVDEPPLPWWHAFRSPKFMAPAAALAGLTLLEIKQTDRCVASGKATCNLFFGKNRAAAYAVNIPLTSAIVWTSARLRERHNMTAAAVVMTGGFMYETIAAYTANPDVLLCRAGRVPQCR
jgi:hypothetical protein